MPSKDEILKIRITEKLKEEAKEFADEKGESLAVIVREALREYMAKNKQEPKEKSPSDDQSQP